MRFEGSFRINADRDKVWEFISNPSNVIQCVPGVQDFSVQEGKRIAAKVKVKIGFISGLFQAASKVLEEDPQNYHARMELSGSGAGSGFKALVDLKLEEADGGTELKWSADVSISGPLGSLAKSMVEGYVKKMVDQLFDCVKRRLEG